METKLDDSKLLMAHWRNEAICWGSIAVAIMDHLELDTPERFSHLAIDGMVKKLMKQAGVSNHPLPKETTALIEKGDKAEMIVEANKAIATFRRANEKRAWYNRQQVLKKNFSSMSA